MPAEILCRVVLPNGERCGFVPEGETAKAKITNLFRHEQAEHIPGVAVDGSGVSVPFTLEELQAKQDTP